MTAVKNLKRDVILPESEEHWLKLRTQDLTSTEIAALFGVSPYMTEFELWHQKKHGQVVRIEESDRMRWGKRLEGPIARGIAEDKGWTVREVNRYIRLPEHRLGSSFDFEIVAKKSWFEIKLVDALQFQKEWVLDDGSIEAPLHIELQAQHQILVGGKEQNHIGVLVGGNRPEVLERVPNLELQGLILEKSAAFWRSIDENRAPEPNLMRDAKFIAQLYSVAQKGKVHEADAELAAKIARHYELGQAVKNLTEQRDAVKAEVLMQVGDAEKIIGDGFSVSMGEVAETVVPSFTRNGFRNFRVSMKKVKEA